MRGSSPFFLPSEKMLKKLLAQATKKCYSLFEVSRMDRTDKKEVPRMVHQDLWSLGRVLSRLYRQTQMWMDRAFEPLGLGRGLYQYLVEVARSPEANQMELAEKLALDGASVTRGIGRLEKLGYVERRRDALDRRMWRISLSPKGKEVLPRLEEEFQRWNRAASLGASEEEITRQVAFLRRSMEEIARCMQEDYGDDLMGGVAVPGLHNSEESGAFASQKRSDG